MHKILAGLPLNFEKIKTKKATNFRFLRKFIQIRGVMFFWSVGRIVLKPK